MILHSEISPRPESARHAGEVLGLVLAASSWDITFPVPPVSKAHEPAESSWLEERVYHTTRVWETVSNDLGEDDHPHLLGKKCTHWLELESGPPGYVI
jgi:hypothetical protein